MIAWGGKLRAEEREEDTGFAHRYSKNHFQKSEVVPPKLLQRRNDEENRLKLARDSFADEAYISADLHRIIQESRKRVQAQEMESQN